MQRPVVLVLASLSLVLLALPLTLEKPGLPPNLKADEPAYYLMALSLARDGDLRVELQDLERGFREFPYRRIENLVLMSSDGWHTAHFGKPYVYSLLAAPFAGLFGANGILLFNMGLLVAMIWMGAVYLGRWSPPWLAALFSAGFFLLSAGFAYVFWIQPEIFNMACVTLALFLGLHRFEGGKRRQRTLAFLSGAALAPAVFAKPMVLALALPLLWIPLRRRRWIRAAAWAVGALVATGLLVGLSMALTSKPTPYLGVERMGMTVCRPDVLPWDPPEEGEVSTAASEWSPTGGAWSWMLRVPNVDGRELVANIGYFLWGRHTGLLLYMPFAALAVALFLAHARRSTARWVLLASLAGVALFFLVFIPFNWQGGGGFVGNRYFVNVYPAFLFLVTRIRPRIAVPAVYALGGLLLGPILLTLLGASVPEPTLQFHTRNFPFGLFPVEHTLREVPGYRRVTVGDVLLVGRKDQVLPRGKRLWLRGADETELWLLADEPIHQAVFQIRSPVPGNRIRLEIAGVEEVVESARSDPPGEAARVTLGPQSVSVRGSRSGTPFFGHRLEVEIERGRSRAYTKRFPPNPCPDEIFGYDESRRKTFYQGAELTYLGDGKALESDLFDLAWKRVEIPAEVVAGRTFHGRVVIENTSSSPWVRSGAAEVKLSYHWLEPRDGANDGTAVSEERMAVYEGLRTDLPLPVHPGERVEVRPEIEAPREPGRYLLALDPVFEHVSWFSRRGVEPYRVEITVVEPR